jgi:hypothetical protein
MTIMLHRRTAQPGEHVLGSLDDEDVDDGDEMEDEEPDSIVASRTTGKKRRLTSNIIAEAPNVVHEENSQHRLAWHHENDQNPFGILIQVGIVLKRLTSAPGFDRYTGAWSMSVIRDLWFRYVILS